MIDCQYTFGISLFHFSQFLEILNININTDSMNNKTSSDVVKRRITRGRRKRKKEEDLKKKKKIRNVVWTRLEEKNMRSLEETRLGSEDIGFCSVFDDDNDGSVTSMDMLKDEVILRIKTLFKNNFLNYLGSKTLTGIACTSFDSMIKFMRFHIVVYFISKEDKYHQKDIIGCIYDDVITGLKNELSLFMKEKKMAAKKTRV